MLLGQNFENLIERMDNIIKVFRLQLLHFSLELLVGTLFKSFQLRVEAVIEPLEQRVTHFITNFLEDLFVVVVG